MWTGSVTVLVLQQFGPLKVYSNSKATFVRSLALVTTLQSLKRIISLFSWFFGFREWQPCAFSVLSLETKIWPQFPGTKPKNDSHRDATEQKVLFSLKNSACHKNIFEWELASFFTVSSHSYQDSWVHLIHYFLITNVTRCYHSTIGHVVNKYSSITYAVWQSPLLAYVQLNLRSTRVWFSSPNITARRMINHGSNRVEIC